MSVNIDDDVKHDGFVKDGVRKRRTIHSLLEAARPYKVTKAGKY